MRNKKRDKKRTTVLCTHSGIIGTLCNVENCNGGCVFIKEDKKQDDN